MSTYTKEGDYKGFPVFQICYMKDGEERTLISFGKKKAEAICEHIQDIRVFAEGNKKRGNYGEVD
jgi:hypothetical protein